MAIPTLLTIPQFSKKHPAFPVGGLRWMRFNSKTNGMESAGIFVQNGRRVLINEEKFFSRLESQNDRVAV